MWLLVHQTIPIFACQSLPSSPWWVAHNLNEVRAARKNYRVSNDLFISTPSSLLKLPGILKTVGYLVPAGSSSLSHRFSMLAIDILSQIQSLKHSVFCWLNWSFNSYKTSWYWHTGTSYPIQNDSKVHPGLRLIGLVSAADIIYAAGGLLPSVSSPEWEFKITKRLQQTFWISFSYAMF